MEFDAHRSREHARSQENRLVQRVSEKALLKLAQASKHLGGSLGVAYIGDFLCIGHLENLLDIGRLVVDSHLEPGPVILCRILLCVLGTVLVVGVREILVDVRVARASVVGDPDIVATVDQL